MSVGIRLGLHGSVVPTHSSCSCILLLLVRIIVVHGSSLLLKVLKGRPNLEPFLKIIKSGVFEARIADKVVQLVPRLNNVKI